MMFAQRIAEPFRVRDRKAIINGVKIMTANSKIVEVPESLVVAEGASPHGLGSTRVLKPWLGSNF